MHKKKAKKNMKKKTKKNMKPIPTDKKLVRALTKASMRAMANVIQRDKDRNEIFDNANAETFQHLKNHQLVKLAWMRLKNSPISIFEHSVTKVKLKQKWLCENNEPFSCSFIVSTNRFSDEILYIVFNKFYPDEFFYLIEQGCFVKQKRK